MRATPATSSTLREHHECDHHAARRCRAEDPGLSAPAKLPGRFQIHFSAKDNLGVTGFQVRTRRGTHSWSAPVAMPAAGVLQPRERVVAHRRPGDGRSREGLGLAVHQRGRGRERPGYVLTLPLHCSCARRAAHSSSTSGPTIQGRDALPHQDEEGRDRHVVVRHVPGGAFGTFANLGAGTWYIARPPATPSAMSRRRQGSQGHRPQG